MGQYYIAVNLDKKEVVNPHSCGNGAKLLEFALSASGMMSAIAILLADGNGRGGGDLFGAKCEACDGRGALYRKDGKPRMRNGSMALCKKCKCVGRLPAPEIVGSWAGDRVVICGDYGDEGKFLPEDADNEYVGRDGQTRKYNLYSYVGREDSEFTNVSVETMRALKGDQNVELLQSA
jgi:hypothetical protein